MGHVILGRDTVGEAVIVSGMTEVSVVFDQTYSYQPVITISKNTQGALADYYIDEVTRNGFKIKINTPQNKNFVFSWHAFGAKNAFNSSPDLIPELPTCELPQILVNNVCDDPTPTEVLIEVVPTVPEVPTCELPQILVNNVCDDPTPTEVLIEVVPTVPEVPTCELSQILVNNVCETPVPIVIPPVESG